MVENKTGVLPRLLLRIISQLTAQDKEMEAKVIKYINKLGTAFQIQDDIIAVTSEQYKKERGIYAEDIHEGKRSLMVIHSFFYGYKGDRLLQILD
jgi:geranylgeranyl pyrophosphate synthase